MTDTTAPTAPVLSSVKHDKRYEIEHLGLVIDGRFVGQHLLLRTVDIPGEPTQVLVDIWRLTGSATWSNYMVGGRRSGGGRGTIRSLSAIPADVLALIAQVDPGTHLLIQTIRDEES